MRAERGGDAAGEPMSLFDLAAVFMGLVGAIGWLNARWLRLPMGVAMLLAGLAASVAFHLLGAGAPRWVGVRYVGALVGRVNFPGAVVGDMLAFLLFAGGMQVDLGEMRRRRLSILSLATLGVLASTAVVGFGVFWAARALGLGLSLAWSLVFGALISPTDPVAVLAVVRRGREGGGGESGGMARSLQAVLQGEALFNDGVGIVVFTAALAFATGHAAPDPLATAGAVLVQALGGLALGVAGGLLVVVAMRALDDYVVEVALSIALAAGVYSLGQALHLSGAIAAVAAGLVVGDHGVRTAMSEVTRRYLEGFWSLVDEILNALLFLLLGLEMVVLPFDLRYAGLWATAIPLVLLARLATVLPWGAYFRFRQGERGSSLVLTWGGLRGALSLALALQTPQSPAHGLILSMTYAVVVFAMVVQGLSFAPLARAMGALTVADDEPSPAKA